MTAPPGRRASQRLGAGLAAWAVLLTVLGLVAAAVLSGSNRAGPEAGPVASQTGVMHDQAEPPPAGPEATPTAPASSIPVANSCEGATRSFGAEPAGIPTTRSINIGFEDLVDPTPGRFAELADRVSASNANAVAITVGRLDWTAFPWPKHTEFHASYVNETGRDLVAEAVNALRCDPDGRQRAIVLGIDTLFGRYLESHPEIAGRDQAGAPSELFASLSAWKDGGLADWLAELARELAVRYQPDAINITELIFDLYTFGAEDLDDFRASTGLADWPRAEDGAVDVMDPAVGEWRTAAAVEVLTKVRDAVAPYGVAVTSDVRAPFDREHLSRPDIGQGYPELLEVVDRLNLWDFPGLRTYVGLYSAAEQGPLLFAQQPEDFSLEIGLWQGGGGGVISPDLLQRELSDANDAGIASVSVTPASLLSSEHWAVIAEAWNPGP